jgi:hypothetical protein
MRPAHRLRGSSLKFPIINRWQSWLPPQETIDLLIFLRFFATWRELDLYASQLNDCFRKYRVNGSEIQFIFMQGAKYRFQ